eukprot:5616611-Prymnesium_polylepis.1
MLKRKDEWLSPLVLAAAAVNPVYTYSPKQEEQWPAAIMRGDAGVRKILAKWCWGDNAELLQALGGWDRYRRQEGIYLESEQGQLLGMMVHTPVAFFAHVKGTSTLRADKTFAKYATFLVSGFCS